MKSQFVKWGLAILVANIALVCSIVYAVNFRSKAKVSPTPQSKQVWYTKGVYQTDVDTVVVPSMYASHLLTNRTSFKVKGNLAEYLVAVHTPSDVSVTTVGMGRDQCYVCVTGMFYPVRDYIVLKPKLPGQSDYQLDTLVINYDCK